MAKLARWPKENTVIWVRPLLTTHLSNINHPRTPLQKKGGYTLLVNAITISTDTYTQTHRLCGYQPDCNFVNHPSGSLYSKSALTGATKWLSRKQRVVSREGIRTWPRETSGTCGMRFFAKQHEKIKFPSVPLPSRPSRYKGHRYQTRLPPPVPNANVSIVFLLFPTDRRLETHEHNTAPTAPFFAASA